MSRTWRATADGHVGHLEAALPARGAVRGGIRGHDDERHADRVFVDAVVVHLDPVLAEHLAVIPEHDDHGFGARWRTAVTSDPSCWSA
jgi:hypothetical protein